MTNENLPSGPDLDAAAAEQETKAATASRLPICPHCECDPFQPAAIPVNDGQDDYTIYFCGNCRKVITMGRVRRIPAPTLVRPNPNFNPTRILG